MTEIKKEFKELCDYFDKFNDHKHFREGFNRIIDKILLKENHFFLKKSI